MSVDHLITLTVGQRARAPSSDPAPGTGAVVPRRQTEGVDNQPEGLDPAEPAVDYPALLQLRIDQAEEQRLSLLASIDDMRLSRSLTFADDEHDPEGSTVSLDQARDAALLTRTEQSLIELRDAAARVESGSFGRCQHCGREIPAARLQARPEARLCIPCST